MADEIKVNNPWERIPQHANDPGYGEVPPKSNVVELFQEPELPVELTNQLGNATRKELGLPPLEHDLDVANCDDAIKKTKEYKIGYSAGYIAGRSYHERLLPKSAARP